MTDAIGVPTTPVFERAKTVHALDRAATDRPGAMLPACIYLASILLDLLFDPEDQGSNILRNVGAFYMTIGRYIPDDGILHSYCCGTLKFCKFHVA
jgi:hypothetical protein